MRRRRAFVDGIVSRATADGAPFEFDHRIVRPDGTERKQVEEERAQLIHEQAARREAEEANRAKDAIYRNLAVETRLVSDIMDVSRITKGTMPLEMGPVDLTAVLEGALDTVRAAAAARDVTLHTQLSSDTVALTGDARRLQQVLWNLLSNAVKFTREGGLVEVQVTNVAGAVEIAVADDGPGIDPEFLPHVFERFRQADDSPTREHGGLGLGLAIARHIVEQHGGTIVAANREEGGAVLTVRLPAAVTVAAR